MVKITKNVRNVEIRKFSYLCEFPNHKYDQNMKDISLISEKSITLLVKSKGKILKMTYRCIK